MPDNIYDAIVVGSGMSGGWAAKELTEKGLKTLVLERGRDVKHIEDYTTANLDPWQIPYANLPTQQDLKDYPIQSKTYHFGQDNKHFFVKDTDHVYNQEKPFQWTRGYHTGGRSLLWSRHVFRWSPMDFEANAKEGIGLDWPIRYNDLAPWYDYVESFIGVAGKAEGLSQLPDGKFIPPFEMNCLEQHLKQSIEKKFPERNLIESRMAVLTQPHNGRGSCQNRNLCHRGCPYGAYFSSNSSTLPAAYATGNLTLRPHSIVHSIIWNDKLNKATGVRIIDAETMQTTDYFAKLIFLNASALNSTKILMQSTSSRHPNGLGNDSGVLGHYLMDHYSAMGAYGQFDIMKDKYYNGQRSTSVYIPRFRNVATKHKDFLRGYAYEVYVRRGEWTNGMNHAGLGNEWKDNLSEPGPWSIYMEGYAECLPDFKNKISLNTNQKDKWGLPVLNINMEYGPNELAMKQDIINCAQEMIESAGPVRVRPVDNPCIPGSVIHEMGTARMGANPKQSILNKFNQVHTAPNVFVTDGACMLSTACQNPSLTYMALTARAVNYAVTALKKGDIK
jgi:choline dehydrogenase-like flavoprotein